MLSQRDLYEIRYEFTDTIYQLARLRVFVEPSDLIERIGSFIEPGDPPTYGLHRAENLAAQWFVEQLELIDPSRRAETHHLRPFHEASPLDLIRHACYPRAIRVLFPDPGRPTRIIFERYERQPDALARFVEFHTFIKDTTRIDHLSAAKNKPFWPIIKHAIT